MNTISADNFSETVNFLWSVADLIRDKFARSDYKDVILPFTVLRRIDCVLQPTKKDVLIWARGQPRNLRHLQVRPLHEESQRA